MSFEHIKRSDELTDTEKSSPSPPVTLPEEAQEEEVRKITGVRVSRKAHRETLLC